MDEPRTLPSQKQQSWGALLSIVIILLMVVAGAFFAWGKHIAERQQLRSLTTEAAAADTLATTTATSTP